MQLDFNSKQTCAIVREEVDKALKHLESRYGVVVRLGNLTYGGGEISGTLSLKSTRSLAHKVPHFNEEFTYNGKEYKVIDYVGRRPKFPFVCKEKYSGRNYKFPERIINECFSGD